MSDSKEIDYDKLDKTVLALLWYGRFKLRKQEPNLRSYKSYDWDIMNRLHEQGYITDPRNKYKSVCLTEEAEKIAPQLFEEFFKTDDSV